MLAGLAWRNLWRQPRRTSLNLASIAFAAVVMVFLLAFQLGIYATMKENVLRVFDGFAQIQPAGYADDPKLAKTIPHPEALLGRIRALRGIGAAAPRAASFAILSVGEKSFGAAVAGVDPAREPSVSSLHESIERGRYLEPADGAALVLGAALARNLGVGLGDEVTLLGEAADGTIAADALTVVGTFSSGTHETDRTFAQMPLARFQDTFQLGGAVNSIALGGPTLAGVTAALPDVRAAVDDTSLVVQPWTALEPGLDAAIHIDLGTSLLWYASLVVVVVFIILNTLLMSVLERTREFGVLLAVGMRPSLIGGMVWLELLMLAVLGLAAGILIGGAITYAIGRIGLEMPGAEAVFAQWGLPGRLYPRLDPTSAMAGPAAMLVGILIAGLVPFRRIRKLEPVSAMRAA